MSWGYQSRLSRQIADPHAYAPRDPGTLAVVAVAAAGVSAVASISQGMAASEAAKRNADIARRNAVIAQQQAAADAEAQQRASGQALGRARAAYGASGVTSEGSPLDVLASSASLAELDRQNILYKGKLRAMGYQDTAAADDASASNYLMQGYLGAATALGKGAANYGALSGPSSPGLPNNGVSNEDPTVGSSMAGAF
jgi:hypothetical protein